MLFDIKCMTPSQSMSGFHRCDNAEWCKFLYWMSGVTLQEELAWKMVKQSSVRPDWNNKLNKKLGALKST